MIRADYYYSAMCDKCKRKYEEIFFDIYTMIKHLKKREWDMGSDIAKCYCPNCKEKENYDGRQEDNRDEPQKTDGGKKEG